MAESGQAFDTKLFKRLLAFTKPYRGIFFFVAFAAIAMAGLSAFRPHLLQLAIDNSIITKDGDQFLFYVVEYPK